MQSPMTHIADLTDFISNIPLFENLCREELETVASYIRRQQLDPDEILFNQWDRAECVYFVETGAHKVFNKKGPFEYE